MTVPEQVLVNVADLRIMLGDTSTGPARWNEARTRLRAAIPEPEWEPTDAMRASQRRVFNYLDVDWTDDMVDRALKAMRREGLL